MFKIASYTPSTPPPPTNINISTIYCIVLISVLQELFKAIGPSLQSYLATISIVFFQGFDKRLKTKPETFASTAGIVKTWLSFIPHCLSHLIVGLTSE